MNTDQNPTPTENGEEPSYLADWWNALSKSGTDVAAEVPPIAALAVRAYFVAVEMIAPPPRG